MAFLDLFRPSPGLLEIASQPATGIASPWSEGSLEKVIAGDILGLDTMPMSRSLAMRVPAIARGRALVAGTLSRYPLRKLRDGAEVPADSWMYRSDKGQDPHSRMLWTLDDLIFHGLSLWLLERNSRGEVIDTYRVAYDRWSINGDGFVVIDDKRVPSELCCLIEGPQEGLTKIAAATIRGAISLEDSWIQRVTSPVPLVELRITDPNLDLTKSEKQALANEWESARRRGGTAVIPPGLEMHTHGNAATDLFIEGRNAVRLDIANFLNVPSTLLEGSTSTASLTYSTTEGRRNELVDLCLSYWTGPIESRLSQDDIVPRGSAVEFNIDWLTVPGSGPPERKD